MGHLQSFDNLKMESGEDDGVAGAGVAIGTGGTGASCGAGATLCCW